jgi:3-oxoacyl-[acyl-carrier protein] reductase
VDQLQRRAAVVTCVQSAIGLEIARELARQGGQVVVAVGPGFDQPVADGVTTVVANVATEDGANRLVQTCLERHGRLDLVVGSALPGASARFPELTDEQWLSDYNRIVLAAFLVSRAAIPHLKSTERGSLLFVTEARSLLGEAGRSAASATAGALQSFVSVVSKELWEFGVTVNLLAVETEGRGILVAGDLDDRDAWVQPGFIWSGDPSPRKAASVAAWLVSDAAADITGRTVFSAGDTIGELTEIDLVNAMNWPWGWDYQALARHYRSIIPPGPPALYLGTAPHLEAGAPGAATLQAALVRSVHQRPDAQPGAADGPGLLDGRVVAITGAGHGIGMIAAVEMARQGALVLVNNRSEANGRAVVDRIRSEGGTAELSIADVSTRDGAEHVIADCVRSFGRIDVLYNNAGYIWPDPVDQMTPEQFEAVLRVHVHGSFWCTRAAVPHMLRAGFGRILVTGSPGGYAHASPWAANYGTAKGALAGLMRALSRELYPAGITVNCIVPNAPTTRRTPEEKARLAAPTRRWGRFGLAPMTAMGPPTLEKIAPTLAWVVSDAAADVTGRVIFIGGEKLALYREPELQNVLIHPKGWDAASLDARFRAVVSSGPPTPFYADDPVLTAGGGF